MIQQTLQVFWTNRKGAGCMRTFQNSEACFRFLETLRSPAVVRRPGETEPIGGVEIGDTAFFDGDRRRKWFVWIERDPDSQESAK